MKKHNLQNTIRQMQSVTLKDNERARIEATIINHMEANPVTVDHAPIKSPWIGWVIHLGKNLPTRVYVPVVLILAIILVSGTAYGAEGALPGDFLYPVKRLVNEPVAVALTVSPASRANVTLEHAGRRLEEAEVLASRGELDSETAEDLENDFDTKASKTANLIAKIEDNGDDATAATISSRFEARLNSHSALLGRANANANGLTASIKSKVMKHSEQALKNRENNESKVTGSDEGHVKAEAETSQSNSLESISNVESEALGSPEQADASVVERISNAKANLDAGREKLKEKSYGDAYLHFEKANRDATEADTIIKTNTRIKSELEKKQINDNSNGANNNGASVIKSAQKSSEKSKGNK